MASVQRPKAVLKIDRKAPGPVMAKSKVMTGGIGNNQALFATPNPALSVITNQCGVVDKCQTAMSSRAPGCAAARDVQLGILVSLLEAETSYVQVIADACTTREAAIQAIQAAGLDVARVGTHIKALLDATQGVPGGPVALVANATALGAIKGRQRCFTWEYTLDGGKTFVSLPPTPKAKTSVSGLTPLTQVGFRVALTTSDGVQGAWSPIVTLVIH